MNTDTKSIKDGIEKLLGIKTGKNVWVNGYRELLNDEGEDYNKYVGTFKAIVTGFSVSIWNGHPETIVMVKLDNGYRLDCPYFNVVYDTKEEALEAVKKEDKKK